MWLDFYTVKCPKCGTIQDYEDVSSWGSYGPELPKNICSKCGDELDPKSVASDEEAKQYKEWLKQQNDEVAKAGTRDAKFKALEEYVKKWQDIIDGYSINQSS